MSHAAQKDHYQKRRDQFLAVFLRHIEACHISTKERVLVIGGSRQDAELLIQTGFREITLSNIDLEQQKELSENLGANIQLLAIDAEQIELSDSSYDFVFAHDVLHHCRSPHRALCEMLRVARRHVILLEPNDSFLMRALIWTGFSFPYEIFAVVYHGCKAGGVRHSCVPNFIYRWTPHEVHKTASSYLAEYIFALHVFPYWDFDVGEEGLLMRKETRIHALMSIVGPRTLLTLLGIAQTVLNRIPVFRRQGNKLFCCIEKTAQLRHWLTSKDGDVAFNPDFRRPGHP